MTQPYCRGAYTAWNFECPKCKLNINHKVIKSYPRACPLCKSEYVSYRFGSCKSYRLIIAGKVRKFCVLGMTCEACDGTIWGRYHRVDVVCPKCKMPFSYATVPRKHCLQACCDKDKIDVELDPEPKENRR